MTSINEKDFKARLISAVKKEVKQVMEESVTRKFVHEESGSVTSLCGAVEACLSQGLRRRALGLFKTSSTTALLHKIAKHNAEAANISKKVQEIENADPTRRSSSSSDSVTKPTLKKNTSLQGSAPLPKYLWIRLALFEKQLAKVIDYLVSNATKYYDKDSLVADPDYGSILSSLLVGPCALDYSRTKTPDHFWTDPPADELVQRQRIASGHSTPPSARKPILNFKRSLNTSSEDSISYKTSNQHLAKDYVESLHQNSRATLLFGKNNVLVLPAKADVTEPMPGYLSLHQTANCLTIKWTPNQLMNGFTDEAQDKSVYWDYALQVRLDEIVYVHCHQDSETGGTIILVGQDGVQRPPIHFPKGGHMLSFLNCIETGLLPRGRLDPPLWSQRSSNAHNKRRRPLPVLTETEETTKDYVFRIIDNSGHKDLLKRNELMDTHTPLPSKVRVQLGSSSTSSESSTKSFSLDQNGPESPPSICIQAVCDSMKRQIISRAFYGWLAYCRHLSTVRTHLSGLVNATIIPGDGAKDGLTLEKWLELCVDGVVKDFAEVYRLTYFGGMAHDLRKDVWPYLLGHYKFGSTTEERNQLSEETKQAYENTMSEWLAVEAIVRQRDKETQANAIAKLSSESMSGEPVPNQIQRDLSNDVFEDISDYDYESPEEEASKEQDSTDQKRHKKTKQNTIKYESDEDGPEVGCSKRTSEDNTLKNEDTASFSKENSIDDGKDAETDKGQLPSEGQPRDSSHLKDSRISSIEEEPKNLDEGELLEKVGQNGHAEIDGEDQREDEEVSQITNGQMIGKDRVGEGKKDDQQVGEQKTNGQNVDEQKTDEQKPDEQKTDEQNADEQKTDEQNRDEQKTDKQNAYAQKTDEQNTNEQKTDEQNADAQKTDKQNTDEQKTDEQNTDEQKTDEQNTDEQKTDEQKTDEQNTDEQKTEKEKIVAQNTEEQKTGEEKIEEQKLDKPKLDKPKAQDQNQGSNGQDQVSLAGTEESSLLNNEAIAQSTKDKHEELKNFVHNVIVTNASVDMSNLPPDTVHPKANLDVLSEENNTLDTLDCIETHGLASPSRSACVSPASSNGGVYSTELLETFGLNLHRIEKDVQRCDRNYWYFAGDNLDKLRNVMCTYVWEHLDIGYMQGMCDLVAPLLVIFNDESLTYACFCHLMERMVENFPNGNAMDCHFANMRSLIQILDSEMYELMHSHGDYTHFYFCYRWFLLDFKRELVYSDVYATWEVIWAAQHVSSCHFVLFLALALLESYREIILTNSMDFTDIIKFFNEMAERHNASAVLSLARDLVLQLQLLIENK